MTSGVRVSGAIFFLDLFIYVFARVNECLGHPCPLGCLLLLVRGNLKDDVKMYRSVVMNERQIEDSLDGSL